MKVADLQQLADLVARERKPLLDAWRAQVRQLPSAAHMDTPTLNDHIPALIDELIVALRRVSDQTIAEVPTVLHPSDPTSSYPLAVRGGHEAPVTCAACGCRLEANGDAWFHFNPIGGRDARGCRIGCADAAHDPSGRPVSIAV